MTGLPTRSRPCRAPLALALVLDAVLRRPEALELADVGAGHERLAARSPQHEDPHGVVGVHILGGLVQALVHVPRHGVARFRPIEGQGDHGVLALDEDFALLRRLGCHVIASLGESPHPSMAALRGQSG
jgi:hypothetical protein